MSANARKSVDVDRIYKGLNLDDETLRMIYNDNAMKLFFK